MRKNRENVGASIARPHFNGRTRKTILIMLPILFLLIGALIAVGITNAANNATEPEMEQTFTEEGEGYYIWVRAVDHAGNKGPWSEAQRVWIDNKGPSAPVITGVTMSEAAQNYVDKAFTATNANDYTKAFTDIVNTIHAQSLRFPTRVTSTNANTDGYVTIEDPIGEFMTVKEIKGINLGGHLFGSDLLPAMLNKNNADKKAELLKSLSGRFGISEADADSLLTSALQKGQIGHQAQTRGRRMALRSTLRLHHQ